MTTILVFGDVPEFIVQRFIDVLYASPYPLMSGAGPRDLVSVVYPQPVFMEEYQLKHEWYNQKYKDALNNHGFMSSEARLCEASRRSWEQYYAAETPDITAPLHFLSAADLPIVDRCAKNMIWQAHHADTRTYDWTFHPLVPEHGRIPRVNPHVTGIGLEVGRWTSCSILFGDRIMARRYLTSDMDPESVDKTWLVDVPAARLS